MKFFFLLFVSTLVSMSPVGAVAEVAVRHPTTSETEFQALAQALGYTPISEILSENNAVPLELAELFRLRLVDAQSEWIDHGGKNKTPSAIDKFLELTLEADWNGDERKTFVTFFLRKLTVSQNEEERRNLFEKLDAYLVDDAGDLSSMPEKMRVSWNSFRLEARSRRANVSVSLPTDVIALLINGKPMTRQNFISLSIPNSGIRVTAISNSYQPQTFILKGNDPQWPIVPRTAWLNDDCTINKLGVVPRDVEFRSIGFGKCPTNIAGKISPTVAPDQTDLAGTHLADSKSSQEISERFGINRNPIFPTEPLDPTPTAFYKKPWFWGTVGAVVLGAAIAISANQKTTSTVVPVSNSESW